MKYFIIGLIAPNVLLLLFIGAIFGLSIAVVVVALTSKTARKTVSNFHWEDT